MKIFVHLEFPAEKTKETVIPLRNVKLVLVVDQAVQHHLVLILKQIVVIHAQVHVELLATKEMNIVMIITTIVDVNGMEETVVVVMLKQIGVRLVNG